MLHHPDLNKGNEDANEKFMEIKEAYTTLINDEKRTAYNNKIGFYHSDPPPDFKREWTFQVREEGVGVAEVEHVLFPGRNGEDWSGSLPRHVERRSHQEADVLPETTRCEAFLAHHQPVSHILPYLDELAQNDPV